MGNDGDRLMEEEIIRLNEISQRTICHIGEDRTDF
jgi:hypothetical protein